LKKLLIQEWNLFCKKNQFDLTPLISAGCFVAILKTDYKNDHKTAREDTFIRLAKMLQIKII
jgi:hypothetical protein